MTQYVLGRLLRIIPVVIILSIFVFSLMHMLPGDPITVMLKESAATSQEAVQRMRERLGLDDPLPVQYWRFFRDAIRGDFGRSIQTNRPVMGWIWELFPNTLRLASSAMLFAAIIGLPLGTIAAVKKDTIWDSLSMVLALLGVSMPIFWTGLLLILLFSIYLQWIPIFSQGFKGLILPSIALGWSTAAIVARLVRANLLEILREDYVRTARSKGLKEWLVIAKHAMRNALNSVFTIFGLQFGRLLGGAVITETVFGRQGVGRLAVNGVLKMDFPVVQGTILIMAISFMLVNLSVDVICAYLDPRIRYT